MIYEIIGYTASILVAVSLIMASIVKLRIINLAGAILFVAYGLLIGAYPLVLTNGFIIGVNVFYLIRYFRVDKKGIVYLKVDGENDHLSNSFISQWDSDIRKFHAVHSGYNQPGDLRFLALKDSSTPIGIIIIRRSTEGLPKDALTLAERKSYPDRSGFLVVDYVIPKYRDIGLDGVWYSRCRQMLPEDLQFISSIEPTGSRRTRNYLTRNGFSQIDAYESCVLLEKTLD